MEERKIIPAKRITINIRTSINDVPVNGVQLKSSQNNCGETKKEKNSLYTKEESKKKGTFRTK